MSHEKNWSSSTSITVVIPTNNRPEFLRSALTSVAGQQLLPKEVVVVYDNEVTLQPTITSSRFRVKILSTKEHHGASAARNLGAQTASGQWLAFLDDDDWWLPGYLMAASDAAHRHGADIVCTSFLATDGSKLVPEKEAPQSLASADFFVHNPGFRASNLFIRRNLFLELGGFDERLPAFNDLDLGLRLSEFLDLQYTRVSERLVVLRKHALPRLTSRKSPAIQAALPVFLNRYEQRMTAIQRSAFKDRVKRYWELEIP